MANRNIRTISIGPEKCAFVAGELGADGVIDYKGSVDVETVLRERCPNGIDLYFDNVDGPILDAAIVQLRTGGRVTLCGRISQTAASELYGVRNTGLLIGKRGRLSGFIVSDYSDCFDEARQWLSRHLKSGRLCRKPHILNGLEQAPEGVQMLFMSANFGKLIVNVHDE